MAYALFLGFILVQTPAVILITIANLVGERKTRRYRYEKLYDFYFYFLLFYIESMSCFFFFLSYKKKL